MRFDRRNRHGRGEEQSVLVPLLLVIGVVLAASFMVTEAFDNAEVPAQSVWTSPKLVPGSDAVKNSEAPAGPLVTLGGTFTTSSGKTIDTPYIDTLDCDALSSLLVAIDLTGYRIGRSEPANPADKPLRKYEHRVSSARYTRCNVKPANVDGPLGKHGLEQ